ncbi:MAG: M36 family metallopeptidase [Myxococcota bacterium]|nr:M36 family metallopeptidase [Myxococcota bacterium]
MSSGLLRSTLLGLLGVTLISACADDDGVVDTTTPSTGGDGSRIYRSDGGPLTAPSSTQATRVVRDFLATRIGTAADQMVVVSQSAAVDGVAHVRLEQTVGGLRVHGAYVKAAITEAGELVQVIEKLAPASGMPRAATVKHKDALGAAMKELGYDFATPAQTSANGQKLGFARGTEFHREPSVERVAYLDDTGALRQGYLVETWSQRGNQLDHTLVGGNGAIVSTERRTNTDRYNVFVEDPGKTAQSVQSGAGTGIAESPAGWLAGAQTTINIGGNNVRSYLDVDSNNTPDTGGTTISNGDFLTSADLSQSPGTATNRAVAVQNLFFLNNVVHDTLYSHGFVESEGNFQENNFGKGGAGSDSVLAEAQDGGGLDNANFATPADGSKPRIQMYLWSGETPPHLVTVSGTNHAAYGSSFGPAITATGVTAPLALVNDGVGTTSDGCETSPAGSLTGKVAIVDRGTCDFVLKVKNAQAAGATAVLIANNVDGTPFGPGGTDRKIKISSAMISLAAGTTLKGQLGTSANLRTNPAPALRIDGDLDSDIVYHEYGHGLTWRMIGSMSGPLAGALGEGASDTLAFLLNGDDRIGEYSFADPLGIRRQPYENYVGTYASVTGASVHNDGEIYAATMYDLLELYQAAGLTPNDLLRDFVQGMKFTAAGPAYEDMRDGMLQAAPARACMIWTAFAGRGIGVGADGVLTKGGRSIAITQSFAKPATCP